MTGAQIRTDAAMQAGITPAAGAPFCRACRSSALCHVGQKDGYDLFRCAECRTVIAHPLPTADELAKVYEGYQGSANYGLKREKKIARASRRLHRLERLTRGRRFLDVGCNLGFAVAAAQALGFTARGIDVDRQAIDRARTMFGQASFDVMPVEALARAGDKFDIVHSSEVIEHVLEPESFAQSICRLIAPGGVLFLTTPDAGHPLVPRKFETWKSVRPPRHLTYFSREGLAKLFGRYGMGQFKFWMNFKTGIQMTARPLAG